MFVLGILEMVEKCVMLLLFVLVNVVESGWCECSVSDVVVFSVLVGIVFLLISCGLLSVSVLVLLKIIVLIFVSCFMVELFLIMILLWKSCLVVIICIIGMVSLSV